MKVQGRPGETRLAYSTSGESEPEVRRSQPRTQPKTQSQRSEGIRLRLDRRASDRVVTVVTGLPGSSADVLALAKSLKSAVGAGGTVKDGVLELQGDHRARVEVALAGRGLASKRAGG